MRTASLTLLTLLGLAAGALYGQYLLFDPANPIDRGHWTYIAGDLVLVRPLMLLLVPMAFAGAVSATAATRQMSRFSLALGGTLVYFAAMMIVSAILGTAAATLLKPGDLPAETRQRLVANAAAQFEVAADVSHSVRAAIDSGQDNFSSAWLGLVRHALPLNVIDDLSNGRLLGLIVLAMLLGLGFAAGGERTRAAVAFFDALSGALVLVARGLAWLAPVGAFLLVANAAGSVGIEGLRGALERWLLVTVGALAAQSLIVLPLALLIFGRCNPIAYLWRAGRALCVAFGSASSTATLPAAMEAAQGGRPGSGCSRAAANLVLPLGATLNLNGTALFQAAAIVFLCQVYGLTLSMNELVIVVITTTIAAISTAGVPGAGLATLIIVITAVNTSLAGHGSEALPASAIGILIAVDRLLDMCRTTVNVWGNLVGARIITPIAPDEIELNHRGTEAQTERKNGMDTPGLTTKEEDPDRPRRR